MLCQDTSKHLIAAGQCDGAIIVRLRRKNRVKLKISGHCAYLLVFALMIVSSHTVVAIQALAVPL